MDSVIRYVCMLEIISVAPKDGFTTNEIQKKLQDIGFTLSSRSLQKDLVKLMKHYPLVCNNRVRPHRWSFASEYQGSFAPMDVASAVNTILVSEYLPNVIPVSLLSQLSPQLDRAKSFIQSYYDKTYATWLEKVKIVPNGKVLEPAKISRGDWAIVCEAIMSNKALDVSYESLSKGKTISCTLHPYGLMIRQSTTYVLGANNNYDDVRQYALHRCVSLKLSSETFRPNPDFTVQKYIDDGGAGVTFSDEQLYLEALISKDLYQRLRETKLSGTQIILETESDQWFLIRAMIPDDRDTRSWLLSQGAEIIVRRPDSLRAEILDQVSSIQKLSHELENLALKTN